MATSAADESGLEGATSAPRANAAMREDKALLREICDNPADDTPRLVYADWFDDHGQPERAELIRTQIELAKLPAEGPRQDDLLRREKELLARHRTAWLQSLPTWARKEECTFRRGFVEEIATTATRFARGASGLKAVTPLRGVKLAQAPRAIDELAASSALTGLASVNLARNKLSDADVRRLFATAQVADLTRLSLADNRLTDEALTFLAATPHLARLTDLDLGGNWEITAAGVRTLGRSSSLTGLRRLVLRGGHGGAAEGHEMATALAEAPNLSGLVALSLLGMYTGAEGATALAASDNWQHLEELDLGSNYIHDEGAVAWGRCPHLGRLRWLDLSDNSIGPDGVAALFGNPSLRVLRWLNLTGNDLGDEGLRRLTALPALASLTDLFLRRTSAPQANVTGAGIEALAAATHLSRLRSLDLSWNEHVGPKGVAALARSPHLAGLTSLNLAHTSPGARGVIALADSPHLTQLRKLCLDQSHNTFTPEVLRRLLSSKSLASLTELSLSQCDCGPPAAEALAATDWPPGLAVLDLSKNDLQAEGAKKLARCPSLARCTTLGLMGNNINDEGAKALLASRYLERIERLDLSANSISFAVHEALRERFGERVGV